MTLTLTREEIEALTHRVKYSAQRRALDAMGIRYEERVDGSPAVLRATVGAALGARLPEPTARPRVKLLR